LFKYNSRDHFENEELVLMPEDREGEYLTGDYYICVFGRTYSTYKITVKNSDSSHVLRSGMSESFYVDSQEVRNFWFRDWSLLESDISVKF